MWICELYLRFIYVAGVQPPTPEPDCTKEGVPLGMKSGKIPTSSLSASSVYNANTGVDRARLYTRQYGKSGEL